jgi:drug/metabolite transporter (DMT)-like permease
MLPDRLTLSQIILLVIYAAGMSAGQILFKMAALRAGEAGAGNHLIGLIWNGYFLAAAVLYAGYALLWVWILTFVPLSRAYPFVALAFAITPLFGGLLFGEVITTRLVFGLLFILGGLILVTGG